MRRWLGTSIAVAALALIGCGRPAPCIPSRLKAMAASIPACAGAPAGALEAARIKEAALGSRVSVRGLLTIRGTGCTKMGCQSVDETTGKVGPSRCCNGCSGYWRLAGPNETSPNPRISGATEVFLRRADSSDALSIGGLDCVMRAMDASPRVEIIATGRLEPSGMEDQLGRRAAGSALMIDDVTLCATGRWGPPAETADSSRTDCR